VAVVLWLKDTNEAFTMHPTQAMPHYIKLTGCVADDGQPTQAALVQLRSQKRLIGELGR